MKRESLILSTLVSIFSLTTGQTLAATLNGNITFSATSSSSVMAGTVRNKDGTEKKDSDGNPIMTTEKDLLRDTNHAGQYDGATEFVATYTICLDDNNMLDMSKSMVTFDTNNYTYRKYNTKTMMYEESKLVTKENDPFRTLPIKITKVTFMDNDPTMGIESFMFNSNNWYPSQAVLNNGLSGTINLKTEKSSYNPSYINKATGSVYKYVVNGMKKQPSPIPGPEPEDLGQPQIYSPLPVPEPNSTLSLLGLGTLGAASTLKRKLKLSKEKELEKA